MSGDTDDLIQILRHAFDERDRDSLTKLSAHILRHQYVTAGPNKRPHRVIKGTGMGMISSGDIADFVLFCLLEFQFMLVDEIRTRFHIEAYFSIRMTCS